MTHLKSILVPMDFSPSATHAFQIAWSLARDFGGRLILLHVIPPPVAAAPELSYASFPDPDEERQLAERLRDMKCPGAAVPVEAGVVNGPPTQMILDAAGKSRCDLIVMGTHGRTGLGRLLMGSVAEHVLRHAPCPVLTIRAGVDGAV